MELVFGWEASVDKSHTVFLRDLGIYKIRILRITSLWNFVSNSGLRKFLPQHIDRRNVLSTYFANGGRSEREKLNGTRGNSHELLTSSYKHHSHASGVVTH